MKPAQIYTSIISIIILILSVLLFWASTDGLTFINQSKTNQNISMGVIVFAAVFAFVVNGLTFLDWISRKAQDAKKKSHKPFMALDPPENYIQRPEVTKKIIQSLLSRDGRKNVGITTAFEGAGGYGKTELARAVCQDKQIQKKYRDGILWVTLGEQPNLVGKLVEIYKALTGEKPDFSSKDEAIRLITTGLKKKKYLMVIDDGWNESDLRPFLQVSQDCDRLITTRIRAVLPAGTKRVEVDKMLPGEAVQLLRSGEADQISKRNLEPIAKMMGCCPLLLKLANGYLNAQITIFHEEPDKALKKAIEKYTEAGVAAFDADNPRERDQAYSKTIMPSLDLLNEKQRGRYFELVIFPEDISIPLETVSKLWEATGGLSRQECDELCKRLYNLSLIYRYDSIQSSIRLHDVTRSYLISQYSKEQLILLNRQFLDCYLLSTWADLPEDEPYLWDYLVYHLIAVSREEQLADTIKDLSYVAKKILFRSFSAGYEELLMVEANQPDDMIIRLLRQQILHYGHLIKECHGFAELEAFLYCRLNHIPELRPLTEKISSDIPKPWVCPWHPLPDNTEENLVMTITGHELDVSSCAYSPDGRWIVSGSWDRTLRVWDAQNGQEHLILRGHEKDVTCCAFSPDGHWIVSGSMDKTLRVWDANTGLEQMVLKGNGDVVASCAFSSDGGLIISGSWDDTARVWDANTGREKLFLRMHLKQGGDLDTATNWAFSPNGLWIASWSNDRTVTVWDLRTRKQNLVLRGHEKWITCCAFSPDGRWIVSGSFDRTLRVWDLRTGQQHLVLKGHKEFVTCCTFSQDGLWIVSGSNDHTLRIWDTQFGQEHLVLRGHEEVVTSCAFSPDGRWIVSGSRDQTLRVWETHDMGSQMVLKGHKEIVYSCAYSPDGRWIVAGYRDKTLRVWDAQSGQQYMLLSGHRNRVTSCAYSPDGRWIVSGSWDKTLRVWDALTGQEHMVLQEHKKPVASCAYSPDGRWIVSGSYDKTLRVWDALTGKEHMVFRGYEDAVNFCAYSPDGGRILSGSRDGTLELWDPQNRDGILVLRGHTYRVTNCAFSPEGNWIVSGSDDYTLVVWNAQTGQEHLVLNGHEFFVTCCTFSHDGRLIVSGSLDKTIRIWDAQTGLCLAIFHANGCINGCAFSSDGEHIVAFGDKGLYFLTLEQ